MWVGSSKNVIKGKDGGAMSAKILGSDKRVNMFQPEVQQNVLVLQMLQHLDADKMLAEGDG